MIMMSPMSEKTEIEKTEISPDANYTSSQVAEFVELTPRHVVRLADDGQFDGWYRKSPVSGSRRVFPGHVVIAFLKARKENK